MTAGTRKCFEFSTIILVNWGSTPQRVCFGVLPETARFEAQLVCRNCSMGAETTHILGILLQHRLLAKQRRLQDFLGFHRIFAGVWEGKGGMLKCGKVSKPGDPKMPSREMSQATCARPKHLQPPPTTASAYSSKSMLIRCREHSSRSIPIIFIGACEC